MTLSPQMVDQERLHNAQLKREKVSYSKIKRRQRKNLQQHQTPNSKKKKKYNKI